MSIAAGSRKRRVAFQAETRANVGGGAKSSSWATAYTFWGRLRPQPGRESVEGGRLNSQVVAILTVRSQTETRTITTAHRALIDGVQWQIRSITNPDQRNVDLEMVLERGVGM